MQALALAGAYLLLSVMFIVALAAVTPGELAPLQIEPRQMRRLAEEGYFPLAAAALTLKMQALAYVANAQTFVFFAALIIGAAHYLRRGFLNERVRGWSNGVWIGGLVLVCLLPSLFPELTLQQLDYVIIGSWRDADATPLGVVYGRHGLNRQMLPAVFLFERGLFGAMVIAAGALVAHDLGYRCKEALEDFGFIETEGRAQERDGLRSNPHETKGAAAANTGGPEAVFGQRGAPPRTAPLSASAQARLVLGVSASATRRDIERAYRAQMKRAHPDHGGSVERAAALNAARDTLLRRG